MSVIKGCVKMKCLFNGTIQEMLNSELEIVLKDNGEIKQVNIKGVKE